MCRSSGRYGSTWNVAAIRVLYRWGRAPVAYNFTTEFTESCRATFLRSTRVRLGRPSSFYLQPPPSLEKAHASSRSTIRSPGGSSMTSTTSGGACWMPWPTRFPTPESKRRTVRGSASRTNARPRWFGIGRPESPFTARLFGRIVARRSAALNSSRPATRKSSGRLRGWCSILILAVRRSLGCSTRLTARELEPMVATWPSALSIVGWSGNSAAARPT